MPRIEAAWHGLSSPPERASEVQPCPERHLRKHPIFPQERDLGVGGATQFRHCCETGFDGRYIFQSQGRTKSLRADMRLSPPFLGENHTQGKQGSHFPIHSEADRPFWNGRQLILHVHTALPTPGKLPGKAMPQQRPRARSSYTNWPLPFSTVLQGLGPCPSDRAGGHLPPVPTPALRAGRAHPQQEFRFPWRPPPTGRKPPGYKSI